MQYLLCFFRFPDIVTSDNATSTIRRMKFWRKNIKPENIPNRYLDFRNMLYTAEYRVVRLHRMGELQVDVGEVNGESLAIVFYDDSLLREIRRCTELHVGTSTRVIPNNMEDTCQLVTVVAVHQNHVSIYVFLQLKKSQNV